MGTHTIPWHQWVTGALLVALLLGSALVYNGALLDAVLTPRLLLVAATGIGLLIMAVVWRSSQTAGKLLLAFRNPMVLAWLGWIIVSAGTIGQAHNANEALYELSRMTTIFLAFLIMAGLLGKPWARELTIGALNALVPIITLICVYQYWWLETTAYSYQLSLRVEGLFANQNILLMAYLLLLPFSAFWALQRTGWKRITGLVNTVLVLVSLLIYKVTGTALALGGGLTVLFLVGVLMPQKLEGTAFGAVFSKRKLMVGILIAGIAGGLAMGFVFRDRIAFGLDYLFGFNKTEHLNSLTTDSSLNDRTLLFHNTTDMIGDHFPGGVGLTNWVIEFQQYGVGGTTYINQGWLRYMRPHNDFLWVLAETGLLGLALYAALFILALIAALRMLRQATDPETRSLAFVLLFGVVAYIICAAFYFPKERIFPSVILATYLAMLVSSSLETAIQRTPKAQKFGPLVPVAGILLLAGVFQFGWERQKGEVAINIASQAKTAGNWPVCAKYATEALEHGLEIDATATPSAWYAGISLQHAGYTERALDALLKAEESNPHHITMLSDIGGCYALLGNADKSIEYYSKSLNITPCFPDALKNLAIVHFQNKRTEEACALLQRDCLRERFHLPEFQQAITAIFQQHLAELEPRGTYANLSHETIFEVFKESVATNQPFEEQLKTYLQQHGSAT